MSENTSLGNPLQWEPIRFFATTKESVKELTLALAAVPSDTNRQFHPTSRSLSNSTQSHIRASSPFTSSFTSTRSTPFFINQHQSKRINTFELRSPIQINNNFLRSQGNKFVALMGYGQTDVPQTYQRASGSIAWEACSDQIEQCIEFIKIQCEHKAVFLVCSGSLGQKIVPQIHDLPQVYAIYVFCMQVDLHKLWVANYAKIRVVSNDDARDLLPQLAFDSAYFNYEYGCALIEQGKKTEAKAKLERAVKLLETQTNGCVEKECQEMIKKKLEQAT